MRQRIAVQVHFLMRQRAVIITGVFVPNGDKASLIAVSIPAIDCGTSMQVLFAVPVLARVARASFGASCNVNPAEVLLARIGLTLTPFILEAPTSTGATITEDMSVSPYYMNSSVPVSMAFLQNFTKMIESYIP